MFDLKKLAGDRYRIALDESASIDREGAAQKHGSSPPVFDPPRGVRRKKVLHVDPGRQRGLTYRFPAPESIQRNSGS
jgi:hypothetical protein